MRHLYRLFALLSFLLLVLLLTGCDSSDDGPTLLRVENAGATDFSEVVVQFTGSPARFGALPAGQASSYRTFDVAYRYGYIEVTADGETYVLQPIDYVGETPLGAGRYTYRLNIAEGSSVRLTFERD